MTSKPEIIIDATSLAKTHCIKRFYNGIALGLRSKYTFNDIEYGSAGHIFLQTLSKTKDGNLAITEAQKYYITRSREKNFQIRDKKDWLNLSHLTLTCKKYLDTFGTENSFGDFTPINVEEILVEKNFKIPLYEGEKYSYFTAGTMDEIGKLLQGCYAIGDHKFTSYYNKDVFLENFAFKVQLQFYYYNLLKLGEIWPHTIFGDIAKNRIGCFINGIFMSKDNPTTFKRSRIFFFNESHKVSIQRHLERLIEYIEYQPIYREGMCNDTCENKFGYTCEYLPACLAPNETIEETILGNSYVSVPYDPLNFRKI